MRISLITLVAAGSVALGGCAYDGYYGGVGVGYGDYGYRDYGYYNPYYYGGYGYPYGGYGYGSSYYGWYGDSYYPGTGFYVYDRYRRPRAWTSTERSYWVSRQPRMKATSSSVRTQPVARENWSGFNRRPAQTHRQ